MKKNNQLVGKSYVFALRIVKRYRFLCEKKKGAVLAKQTLKGDTLTGADGEKVVGGHSEKGFQHKINIAYEEAREKHCWLRFLRDSFYLEKNQVAGLISDCDELLKIAGSLLIPLKKKNS